MSGDAPQFPRKGFSASGFWLAATLSGATQPHPDGLRIAPEPLVSRFVVLHPSPDAGERTQDEANAQVAPVLEAMRAAAAAAVDALLAADQQAQADLDVTATLAEVAAGALRAALEPPALSAPEEACVQTVRAHLQSYLEDAALEGAAATREAAEAEEATKPKKHGGSDLIAFTAPPVAALEQAVADAAAARGNFALVDGNRRLIHTRDKAGYQVAVDYADPMASVGEALSGIAEHVGLEAVFMVAAACYHAIEHEGAAVHADDVLLDIGWRRDRDGIRETRAEAVERVARTYLRLNAWAVVGASWGHGFEDKDGRAIDVSSRGPLFVTTALDDTQGTLLGRPSVVGFTFRRGEFLAGVAQHPHVLETFGTYRELARMPRQRPADAWAVAIGLALVQRWRELAAHSKVTTPGDENTPTPHVQKIKRGYLLSQYPPSPTPEEVLYERDEATGETKPRPKGKRDAQAYWTKALDNLKTRHVIDADTKCRLAGEPAKLPRLGWGKAWLDEALDGRLPEGYKAEFLSLAERAETHAKKTRRRRRKPKGDT